MVTEKTQTDVVADAQYGIANAKREGPLTGRELDAVAAELAMLGRTAALEAVCSLPLTRSETTFVLFQVIRKTQIRVRS